MASSRTCSFACPAEGAVLVLTPPSEDSIPASVTRLSSSPLALQVCSRLQLLTENVGSAKSSSQAGTPNPVALKISNI